MDHNTLKDVDLNRIPEEDFPSLTLEDVARLRDIMGNGLYRDFIETALYTGIRVSEIRNLRWDDIDIINKKIRAKNTESFSPKSKRERTIPLHPALEEIFSLRSQVDHSPFVFLRDDMKQVDICTVNKVFRRYCRVAGIHERFHFHSLRHTFASHLAMTE